jgi:hypothetical protein
MCVHVRCASSSCMRSSMNPRNSSASCCFPCVCMHAPLVNTMPPLNDTITQTSLHRRTQRPRDTGPLFLFTRTHTHALSLSLALLTPLESIAEPAFFYRRTYASDHAAGLEAAQCMVHLVRRKGRPKAAHRCVHVATSVGVAMPMPMLVDRRGSLALSVSVSIQGAAYVAVRPTRPSWTRSATQTRP